MPTTASCEARLENNFEIDNTKGAVDLRVVTSLQQLHYSFAETETHIESTFVDMYWQRDTHFVLILVTQPGGKCLEVLSYHA
mgnify:CR=1 FL=1